MLVIAGTLTFDPSGHDAVVQAVTAITEATRKEKGCVDYRFSLDISETGMLHVFEHWESEPVWQAHMTTPHVAAFTAAIGGLMKDATVQRYDVEALGPLFPQGT